MVNVLLTISYDGTNYSGWQRQKNSVSVQEETEKALTKLLSERIALTGSSRTDAGVHALCQKASFKINTLKIPIEKLPLAVNPFLPKDIAIKMAEIVNPDFHPRFSAKQKTYEYKIYNNKTPNPLIRRYCAYERRDLDIYLMKEAAKYFIGEHDFTAFKAVGGSTKTSIREIYDCSIKKSDNIITISVTGTGFLYNMVCIIAGTLLYVGLRRIMPYEIQKIILSKDRKMAGKTMPPEGLVLVEVFYL